MTESEAINFLKNNEERNPASRYIRVKQLSISALEKQIPKKPKTNDNYIIYICPCCNNFIKLCKNYCEYCGQKLDWSEEQ